MSDHAMLHVLEHIDAARRALERRKGDLTRDELALIDEEVIRIQVALLPLMAAAAANEEGTVGEVQEGKNESPPAGDASEPVSGGRRRKGQQHPAEGLSDD